MSQNFEIQLVKERDWSEVEESLRQVPLLGDNKLLPYQNAEFESVVVEPRDIWPLSRYVLADNLAFQERLHEKFVSKYKIDTLDLNGNRGGLYFKVLGEKGVWVISPPIVEESVVDGNKLVLVDGEHRFMLARELGQKIRVIVVRRVPVDLPVVARPVSWDEVKIYDQVPAYEGKRDYRYKSLKEFPDLGSLTLEKVTEENFRYFFYRDVSGVCSSGVRMVGGR